MSKRSSVVLAILFLIAPSSVHANVLVDHVSDPSLFDGQPLILHEFPLNLGQTTLAGTAATFIGDGNILSCVAGVFATVGSDGSLNNGDINGLRFRISFFDSVDAYLADPFGQSLSGGNSLNIFNAPTNTDFLTPVGTAEEGHDLLLWEFEVESLGIRTTAGETQLVLIHPEVGGGEGGTFTVFSTGGPGAVGDISFFNQSTLLDFEGDQLIEQNAPSPFAAFRVETVEVPEPSTITTAFFALLFYAGKSRCRAVKRRH